ncbi:MAG: energy transducer TonB [Calditrichaeota bacterium]|nr:energy transducer TonB [Calditrichota bacterium]MCB9367948.1 energy transducer TonB [Calditrichota bacterium]
MTNFLEELEKGKYGSIELKKFVGKNLLRGLAISVAIHTAVVAAPMIATLFKEDIPPPDRVVVVDPSILEKLKRLNPNQAPPKIARPKLAPPKVVVPIAVSEEEVPEEQPEILKQEELVQAIVEEYGDDTLAIGEGVELVIEDDGGDIPGYDQFIPFEVPPQPLPDFSPQPAFPEMAQRAGVSGKVTAQVYVDKKGEVKKWRIVQAKPEKLGFEEEVEKVLPKWKFTPAIQQGNPVGVWIAIPFNFKVQ